MPKPRLLVHVCCAPDALYVFGVLKDGYEVTGFFSNSNIHPREEYDLRLDEARKVARLSGVPLIEDDYDPDGWIALTAKFKDEPEKGRRCDVCYAARLARTAERAAREGFDAFATVMSLSPWKKAAVMNRIGRQFAARHGHRLPRIRLQEEGRLQEERRPQPGPRPLPAGLLRLRLQPGRRPEEGRGVKRRRA